VHARGAKEVGGELARWRDLGNYGGRGGKGEKERQWDTLRAA